MSDKPSKDSKDSKDSNDSNDSATALFVYEETWVRGLCVLAVVVIHCTPFTLAPLTALSVLMLFANSLARFAVPIFVLLSGFHLSLNRKNERAIPFYQRTLKPLVVAYLVYSTLFTLVTPAQGKPLLGLWLSHIRHADASPHLWFIPVLVELYLLHPFLRRLFRRAGAPALLVAGAFAIQLAYALLADPARREPPLGKWLGYFSVVLLFLPQIGYFLLGYYLRDHAARVRELVGRPRARVAAALVWLAAAGTLTAWWAVLLLRGAKGPHPELPLTLLAPPLSLAAFVLLVASRPRSERPNPLGLLIHRCGLYAYGVYYLHLLVRDVLFYAAQSLVGPDLNVLLVVKFLAFPLVAAAAVVTAKMLSKLPWARQLT